MRATRALHQLLGLNRFPGHDTVGGLFLRFSEADIQTLWRLFWRGLLGSVALVAGGFTLDLDSTVFQRAGRQQGHRKGYNPRFRKEMMRAVLLGAQDWLERLRAQSP